MCFWKKFVDLNLGQFLVLPVSRVGGDVDQGNTGLARSNIWSDGILGEHSLPLHSTMLLIHCKAVPNTSSLPGLFEGGNYSTNDQSLLPFREMLGFPLRRPRLNGSRVWECVGKGAHRTSSTWLHRTLTLAWAWMTGLRMFGNTSSSIEVRCRS